MSHPLAHVVLGSHYVVGADLVKDAGVSVTYRLCPYVRYAEAQHDRGSQNARLDVGADCDHRAIELVNRQLAQGLLVSGVGGDHLGEPAGQRVDQLDVAIDSQYVDVLLHQFQRYRFTEPAESDDNDSIGTTLVSRHRSS